MMQRMLLCTLVCLFLIGRSAQAGSTGDVSYQMRWVQGVRVHVVTVDMNRPNVKVSPALAQRGTGTSEGFGSMLSRLQPAAAVTGTFFCMNSLVPVADLVVDSSVLTFGSVGTGICFTADNRVDFVRTSQGRATGWVGYESVICGGPMLVQDGIPFVNPRSEGFRDSGFFRPAARSAIGVTKDNNLLLVSVNKPVYLSHLARVMRDLGAVDAINMDGGTSTALYCKGVVPSHPGRRLTNLIVVYDSLTTYEARRPSFGATTAMKSTRSAPSTERDAERPVLSMPDSESAAKELSTRFAEALAPTIGVDVQAEPGTVERSERGIPRPVLSAPKTGTEHTNKEAAACESGPLPRRVSKDLRPSGSTSFA